MIKTKYKELGKHDQIKIWIDDIGIFVEWLCSAMFVAVNKTCVQFINQDYILFSPKQVGLCLSWFLNLKERLIMFEYSDFIVLFPIIIPLDVE